MERSHFISFEYKQKHKSQLYIDMATIGISNFTFRILEHHLPQSQLDEKETFYIQKYRTNCYNITDGGTHKASTEKLTEKIIKEIIIDIQNDMPFTLIAEKYNIHTSTVSDINCGDTWHQTDISYPIKNLFIHIKISLIMKSQTYIID